MSRGSRGGGHNSSRRPIDLTGHLSLAEKEDLTTLITAITDKLFKELSTVFDSPPVSPIDFSGNDHHHHHHRWIPQSLKAHLAKHLPIHHDHDDKENADPTAVSNIQPSAQGDGSNAFKQAHSIVEKEEQESLTPQLRELKKEATATFRKWQDMTLKRIRDMIVYVPEVQQTPAGRGRGGRGSARGRGGRGAAVVAQVPTTLATTGPPRLPSSPTDLPFARRYPPIPNTLYSLTMEKRKLMVHITLLLLLSHQEYNAWSRLLLMYLSSSLNVPLKIFQDTETRVARALSTVALGKAAPALPVAPPTPTTTTSSGRETPDSVLSAPLPPTKGPKRWRFGANGPPVAGALSEALTTASIDEVSDGHRIGSNVVAGLLGSLADDGYVVGSLFGMNATRPASKSLDTFARDVPDFAVMSINKNPEFEYPITAIIPAKDRRLRVVIAISGWLTKREDITKPWRCLGQHSEAYALRWEMSSLLGFGTALQMVIKSTAWGKARKQVATQSIRMNLLNSQWPEPLLKMSKLIDNAWSVGMVRAEKTGVILADAIQRSKFQGDRPVSLVGFSLAARTIYTCLMVLAERRCFGLIDSVVLMGVPAPSESRVWLTLKSVVSGRLVNVYSESDFILGFLCRTSNIQFGIAGLEAVQGADGIENFNVGRAVDGHLGYQNLVAQVLRDIGWEDVSPEQPRASIAPPVLRGGGAMKGRGRKAQKV